MAKAPSSSKEFDFPCSLRAARVPLWPACFKMPQEWQLQFASGGFWLLFFCFPRFVFSVSPFFSPCVLFPLLFFLLSFICFLFPGFPPPFLCSCFFCRMVGGWPAGQAQLAEIAELRGQLAQLPQVEAIGGRAGCGWHAGTRRFDACRE